MSAFLTLPNGVQLPIVGLGTFKARGLDVQNAVTFALEAGIKHFDTASIYKNEADIAAALQQAGVPRSSVFLTSKVSPYQQGTAKATAACEQALAELKTDYIDLMLIHWPGAAKTALDSPLNAQLRLETWRVLERFHRQGRFRAIGVSNYTEAHLEQLAQAAEVAPMVNQIEVHPRLPQRALLAACARLRVMVVAYSSLGCGDLLAHPLVVDTAAHAGKSPAQVLLRWGLQQGCAVVPKSVHAAYIKEWAPEQLLAWQLDDAAMTSLETLDDGHKYCWDSSNVL